MSLRLTAIACAGAFGLGLVLGAGDVEAQTAPISPVVPSSTSGAAGGPSIGPQGGFTGISPTWDIQFDGARVESESEVHVFVSARNRSTSDQHITPGNFIPRLEDQDGKVLTNRVVYRAVGETPTEFRPTVPVDEAVRLRFIFRLQPGAAPPRAFTLEQFGHRKLTFDVSALRIAARAP